MRLGFAFVFVFLGVIGHVASYATEKLFVCSTHRECAVTLGQNCFCLKQPYQHRGECLCKLDPDVLKNDCAFDSECKARGEGCYCAKQANESIGKCSCEPLLLG